MFGVPSPPAPPPPPSETTMRNYRIMKFGELAVRSGILKTFSPDVAARRVVEFADALTEYQSKEY